MPPRFARGSALGLGVAVLAWQLVNAARGRLVHPFLVADLILGIALITSASLAGVRRAAVAMLASFAAMGGVFLAATTMRLVLGGYDLGTLLTTLGVPLCGAWVWLLGRFLLRG